MLSDRYEQNKVERRIWPLNLSGLPAVALCKKLKYTKRLLLRFNQI